MTMMQQSVGENYAEYARYKTTEKFHGLLVDYSCVFCTLISSL